MNVRVGLCGFTMSMHEYGRHFPVVEVQNTFYDPPRDTIMRKWLAATGTRVEYTMKVWQLVTHSPRSPTYRRLKRTLDPAAEPGFFRDSPAVAEGWAESLRCARVLSATAMLFQCPASFTPTEENVERMRGFFDRIERTGARLLWEPRGAAWVEQRDLALALCDELDLVHVVDPFVTPPEPGRAVYWRLHGLGSARHSYDDDELRTLERMLRDVQPAEPAYVLFNNLPRVGDARRFSRMMLGRTEAP
jgi:uncharacterized protein YecE (DUF72 family)